MKIGIVGPGAMGCLLAGMLARAGLEVMLLDHRPDRAEHIRLQGLRLETGPGEIQVPVAVTLEPLDLSGVDLVLICVKAYDTEAVARRLRALDPPPYFLTLQNGVGNVELLGAYLPREKVLAGITSHGATALGPGWVRHAGSGDTLVGAGFAEDAENRNPGVRMAQQGLSSAGFETQTVPRINPLIWSKLLVNVGINALTALTRLRNGDLLSLSVTEQTLEEAVAEAILVARAKGIELVYDDPLGQVKKVCRSTAPNLSSMLQDVLKEKRTEIDFINGTIIREAEKLRIPVPVNALLTRLVQALEQSYSRRINSL
jgi:2-dehydropantoate 2-reductase